MDELISKQAAIDALAEHEKSRGHNYTLFVDIVSECAEIIRDLPSAQPRKRGKWIIIDSDEEKYEDIKCPNCKMNFTVDACRWCDIGFTVDDLKFCPNCGAEMQMESQEEVK